MTVLTILAIVLLILIGITLLRLRVRFEFGHDDRRIFLGLGRSGIEIDYLGRSQTIRVAGLAVKRQPLSKSSAETTGESTKRAKATTDRDSDETGRGISVDSAMVRKVMSLAPQVLREAGVYSKALLSRVIVERLEADIRAGFDSPDMTGQTYGAYHAVMGAVPALAGHVRFTPDWQGASFYGRARGSLALPLYQVLLRMPRLVWRLPLREIVKMAKGIKKGDHDGQQRS